MSNHYNLRPRANNSYTAAVEPDVVEVANILCNLRSGRNYLHNDSASAASKYSSPVMTDTDDNRETKPTCDEDWVDELPDEDIVRQACSCIARRTDPPERFFELLRMYDGGELSADFVDWMYGIPPIRRYMENPRMRKSCTAVRREGIDRKIERMQQSQLTRTKNAVGFSTNLLNLPAETLSKKSSPKMLYNLRSRNRQPKNMVTTLGSKYNTRSTKSETV